MATIFDDDFRGSAGSIDGRVVGSHTWETKDGNTALTMTGASVYGTVTAQSSGPFNVSTVHLSEISGTAVISSELWYDDIVDDVHDVSLFIYGLQRDTSPGTAYNVRLYNGKLQVRGGSGGSTIDAGFMPQPYDVFSFNIDPAAGTMTLLYNFEEIDTASLWSDGGDSTAHWDSSAALLDLQIGTAGALCDRVVVDMTGGGGGGGGPGPTGVVFLDNFNGASGTIAARVPDVGDGMWTCVNNDVVLLGDGTITSNGTADWLNAGAAFCDVTCGDVAPGAYFEFVADFKLEFPTSQNALTARIDFYSAGYSDNDYFYLNIGASGGSIVASIPGSVNVTQVSFATPWEGPHTYRIEVKASQSKATLLRDGAFVADVTWGRTVGTYAIASPFFGWEELRPYNQRTTILSATVVLGPLNVGEFWERRLLSKEVP